MLFALTWQAWVTLGVVILMMVALIKDVARPDLVMLGCVGLLLLFNILPPDAALAGFANNAVLTVASLFVVAAGVQKTGALDFVDKLIFDRSGGVQSSISRLMIVTASMSAFLNNTPLVAMLIPRVQAWCDRTGVPASKLMIPLSFAAIVGGMTTLIGTSTNLLVSGLLQASGYEGLGLFDLTLIGVPAALATILYFSLFGYRLLPDRGDRGEGIGKGLDKCFFEVKVASTFSGIGQTLEEAGLRSLADAYVVHVRRGDRVIPSSPELILQEDDVLTLLGSTTMLDRLLERPGLERLMEEIVHKENATLPLFEAVVAASSQLVGRTLRDVGFRENYRGVVLGIRRRDETVEGPLGRIPIRAGDLLLVEAANGFDRQWNANRDEFYLVAPHRPPKEKPNKRKAPLALAILLGVVAASAIGLAPIVTTAFVGALAMIVTRCLSGAEARKSVDIPVLIVIAAALGLGRAIEMSGLAQAIGDGLISGASGLGPIAVLAAVYIATSLLTEFVTNNAAAALMLAIGLAAASGLQMSPEPFAIAVAISASASFLTPIGYQTNLMVMAAGGYRFSDYITTGIYVNLIVAITTISMIWLIYF